MACKGAKRNNPVGFGNPVYITSQSAAQSLPENKPQAAEVSAEPVVLQGESLIFGVDSKVSATTMLQNNLTVYEWARRNKVEPSFWGRNINGDGALTAAEIRFLHEQGCTVAATYTEAGEKLTEEQGRVAAKKVDIIALELGLRDGAAIFLELGATEFASTDFMKGFADSLLASGFIPGFKANTDAEFGFDREFSRGIVNDGDIFKKCVVWATAPNMKEYDRVNTTHLIHPDIWQPFAPSGIRRSDIRVWQYGLNCHPIDDEKGAEVTFNVDLIGRIETLPECMI